MRSAARANQVPSVPAENQHTLCVYRARRESLTGTAILRISSRDGRAPMKKLMLAFALVIHLVLPPPVAAATAIGCREMTPSTAGKDIAIQRARRRNTERQASLRTKSFCSARTRT